jgi:methionyl-tRNA synthetase
LSAPIIGLVTLLALWTLVWKGLALWHAARRGEYWWFVALLLINTVGILEIIYLFVFAKLKLDELFTKRDHHNH